MLNLYLDIAPTWQTMTFLTKLLSNVFLISLIFPRIGICVKISCWQCTEPWVEKPLVPFSEGDTPIKDDFDRGFEINKCKHEHGEITKHKIFD